MSVWTLAVRNVVRHRRRSLLAGAVVAVGFVAVTLAGGFVAQSLEGLREGTIRSGLGHLQVADPRTFGPAGNTAAPEGLARAGELGEFLRRHAAVREVLPRIELVGLITNGTRSLPFLGTGLEPAAEARAMDLAVIEPPGAWLSDSDPHAVVLGAGLAGALSVRAGDTVTLLATTADGTLNAVDATVAGVAAIPIQALSERYLATTLTLASELLQAEDRATKFALVLASPRDARPAALRLGAELRERGFDVEVRSWEELAVFYRQVRLLYTGIFGFMGAVLVAVVLLAAWNTMLMAAAERTREIGTLRALGTRPATVRRLFVAEGLVLALGACAVGAIAALIARAALNQSGIVLPPPPGVAHGMPLHVKFYAGAYCAAAVSMSAIMMLAAYLPARRACRQPIVEALAHV